MQLKRKIKRVNFTAAILLTGYFVLTTASAGMAEGTTVQLDFAKIQQTLNKGGTASGGIVAPAPSMSAGQMPAKGMQPGPGPAVIGMMDEEMNQVIKNTMGGNIMTSDIMAEMQKKIMGENMGSMQETIQASVMKNMQGSVQQSAKDSMTTK